MNFDILFYSDFNTDLIQKFLLAKYKIKSISTNFSPQRISPIYPIEHSCENCIVWFSLESFKTSFLEENNDIANFNDSKFDTNDGVIDIDGVNDVDGGIVIDGVNAADGVIVGVSLVN